MVECPGNRSLRPYRLVTLIIRYARTCMPVYSGVFRCIPVYFGVFRCLVGPVVLMFFCYVYCVP